MERVSGGHVVRKRRRNRAGKGCIFFPWVSPFFDDGEEREPSKR